MSLEELLRRLEDSRVVPVTPEEWKTLAGSFDEVGRHDTLLAGDLAFFQRGEVVVALEQPSKNSWVLRRLADLEAASAFLEQRLEEYERMWDGCGCKIEYYR